MDSNDCLIICYQLQKKKVSDGGLIHMICVWHPIVWSCAVAKTSCGRWYPIDSDKSGIYDIIDARVTNTPIGNTSCLPNISSWKRHDDIAKSDRSILITSVMGVYFRYYYCNVWGDQTASTALLLFVYDARLSEILYKYWRQIFK